MRGGDADAQGVMQQSAHVVVECAGPGEGLAPVVDVESRAFGIGSRCSCILFYYYYVRHRVQDLDQ